LPFRQLNFLYSLRLDFEEVQTALAGFIERHGKRFWRLRVTGAEIRIVLEDAQGNIQPIRAIIENVSGFVVKYEAYREVSTDKGQVILKSIGPQGAFHLQPVNFPYPTKEWLQPKRYKAHVVGTTYVYDFPDLFRQAIRRQWKLVGKTAPAEPLVAKELVLDEFGTPQEVSRPPGTNNIGMVGWIYTIYTPECPQGRRIVVIANDITFKIGSFGPDEDRYFFAVTEVARKLGLPRVYLSANSGARLGIAEELVDKFDVAWVDASRPEKGFKYLYLTAEKLGELKNQGEKSVITQKIEDEGEVRYQITDVIGLQDGLGVESLKGSGLIAGETSRAYDDIFTITLVTARSVGIGAYLVRLGQRAVQVEGQPIILTGAGALNKVLGREVYSSNLQLGGTQIMYKNGVSHLTAPNDLEGVLSIVRWLGYVPASRGAMLPIMPSVDSWDRPIDYTPIKGAYDPRWFLAGKTDESDGRWLSGFFDKDSFQETLSGWAQTVVVGRARLGGIPMGAIAVETRTIERVVPADPANPLSNEQKIMEAGQVRSSFPFCFLQRVVTDLTLGMHAGLVPELGLQDWPGNLRLQPRGFAAHHLRQLAWILRWTAGHVRRGPQARFAHRRRPVGVQAAGLCVHRPERRTSWWCLGRARPVHQRRGHDGDVRRRDCPRRCA
jgi:acetyl-CoA carboxylase/biotin carboxylase 1